MADRKRLAEEPGKAVLYVHRTQARGAEGTHILRIVHALEQMGHRVDILSPPGVDPRSTAGQAPVDKTGVKTRGIGTVWKWISRHIPNWMFEILEIANNVPAYLRTRAALRSRHYDVVYERYAFFTIGSALAARAAGVPLVLEANEASGIANRARPQVFLGLCNRFERFLLRRCAGALAVSSTLKDMLVAHGMPAERVQVCPNAVNPDDAELDRSSSDARRQELGLADAVLLGVAGWFDEWDRLDFLMRVVKAALPALPGLQLVVIGDGPGVTEAREVAGSLGIADRVVFTGSVPKEQMKEHLGMLDMAILPHSNDFGSPIILFEMLALGIPVIAAAVPPIRDVVHNDDVALVFEPLNEAQCVAAVTRMGNDAVLRRTLSAAARERVLTCHTWSANAARIFSGAGHQTSSNGHAAVI